MKYTTIKFKPTGNEFVLPEDEAIRILKEDRGNYEIIGKESKHVREALAEEVVEETSVFSQVVEEPEEAAEIEEAAEVEETPIEKEAAEV